MSQRQIDPTALHGGVGKLGLDIHVLRPAFRHPLLVDIDRFRTTHVPETVKQMLIPRLLLGAPLIEIYVSVHICA